MSVRESLVAFIRSTGKSIGSAERVHIARQWLCAAYAPCALSQTPNDNKDNISILLPTFCPFSPFPSGRTFSDVPPFRDPSYNAPLSRSFHLYLMHRGIAKRISDLNTDAIMREIKLASIYVVSQTGISRTSVTPKWIKCFSPAPAINSQHEREESINARSFITEHNGHV